MSANRAESLDSFNKQLSLFELEMAAEELEVFAVAEMQVIDSCCLENPETCETCN